MSGNWVYIRKNAPQLEKAFTHSHLRLQSTRGNWLLLHDVRRFAKWRWVDNWSSNRSPCPLTEYNQFAENLKTNWHKSKDFEKPLCELLMNQKWFSGIGNYIRAEVLYRLDVDPFQPAKNMTLGEVNQLITIIHLAFRDTYTMGGGQLKDWVNPNGSSAKNFKEWIKCYSKSSSSCIVDKSGRKFWFDPKWLNSPHINNLQKKMKS
jgi:endonuclease VIII-like 1